MKTEVKTTRSSLIQCLALQTLPQQIIEALPIANMPILLHLFYQHSCDFLWILGEPAQPCPCSWGTLPWEWVNAHQSSPSTFTELLLLPKQPPENQTCCCFCAKSWKPPHTAQNCWHQTGFSNWYSYITHIWFKPPLSTCPQKLPGSSAVGNW